MKIAVVNMKTEFACVEQNLVTAEEYIKEAVKEKAELIIFPEFFTSGFGLDKKLLGAVRECHVIRGRLGELSKKYQIALGGSYLAFDEEKKDIYNEFGLFFSTGEAYFHRKDIPTAIESFCYVEGDRISAFDTPIGKVGVVMCWEQLRWDTVRRMKDKIDLLVGGSCWWTFTPEDGMGLYESLGAFNKRLAEETPYALARLLGVPYVHASHCGTFPSASLSDLTKSCCRKIEGETVIVDAYGNKVMEEKEKPGVFVQEVTLGRIKTTVEVPDGIWIKALPKALEQGFYQLNARYHKFYLEVVRNQFLIKA